MDKDQVELLFFEGKKEFEDGRPIPANRVRAMGWRHAKSVATQLELNLEMAYEAFVELERPAEPIK